MYGYQGEVSENEATIQKSSKIMVLYHGKSENQMDDLGVPPMTYETSIYQKVIKGIDLIIGTVWKCNELHL